MNKFEKILLILMISVLLIGMIDVASAQQETDILQTLGKVVQNECAYLKQVCANCTYVNITRISAPNTQILLSTPIQMTKTDTTYNFTFCNTSQIGQYIVDWKADPNGIVDAKSYNFFVGLTNIEPSTSQGTIYMFLGLLSLVLFGLSLFGAIRIKWSHPRNAKNEIVSVNDLRYIKLFLWFFTYLMAIFITFAFRHVSKLADWDVAANWLNFIFWILIVFLIPVFIIVIITGIISFFDAKKLDNLISRGFKPK